MKEYGDNLDNEIKENFLKVKEYNPQEHHPINSNELGLKISELINLKHFNKIFEIIEGNDKVNKWVRDFDDF